MNLSKIVSDGSAGEPHTKRPPALRWPGLRPYLPDPYLLRALCRACTTGSARIIALTWRWCWTAPKGDRLLRATAPAGAAVAAVYGVRAEGRTAAVGIIAAWVVAAAVLAPRGVWARPAPPTAATAEPQPAAPTVPPEAAPVTVADIVRTVRQIATIHDWSGAHLSDIEDRLDVSREQLRDALDVAGIEVEDQLKLRLPDGRQRNRQGVRLAALPAAPEEPAAGPAQHPADAPGEHPAEPLPAPAAAPLQGAR